MNQTKTSHADPVEDQVVTGVDGEELSELINQYEESAKNTSNDKDEDGGNLRTFQNKIFKGVLRYTAIALAFYHIYALIFQLPIPLVLYSIHWGKMCIRDSPHINPYNTLAIRVAAASAACRD